MSHHIELVGNLTAEPDQIRYAGETPVLNVNVAVNRREKVRGEWQDGTPTFYRLNIWRDTALNAAETLRKGMQVLVTGTVKSSSYEKDGQQRTSLEIDVDHIGPSLRFQTAQVQRVQRQQQPAAQPAADPWVQQQGGWGGAPSGDAWGAPQQSTEAPF